jgi:hypothetical protein
MKKTKYQEGPKARENFERSMIALFKVSKADSVRKIKAKRKKGKD